MAAEVEEDTSPDPFAERIYSAFCEAQSKKKHKFQLPMAAEVEEDTSTGPDEQRLRYL